MGLIHLLIAALAANAALVSAACGCVNDTQIINPISNPMIFFQQPTEGGGMNGKTCSMPCHFTASLDKDESAYSLQIQILTNKLGDGSIAIGGMNGSITTITSNVQPGVLPQYSYGDSITLDLSEEPSNLGEFMIVVQKVAVTRPDAPKEKTTTTALPTPAYDPNYKHNPRLVANDIMLAFDLSSPYIDKYKKFASDLINELAIKPKPLDNSDANKDTEDCGDGSRLTVVGLSSISGFTNLYAPYWTTTAEQATGNIGSFVQISNGPYFFEPVKSTYVYGFSKKDDDNIYTTCKNRGRIFVLLTSSSPAECDTTLTDCGSPSKNVPVADFIGNGVHQILVRYNMDKDAPKYYNLYNKTNDDQIWNYFDLGGVSTDVMSFINNYLVDSTEQMTCQLKSKTAQTEVLIGKGDVSVSIPSYYNAKGVDGGEWETVKHYCNFQETTVNLKRADPASTKVCLKVYYDLETGKDFVSIFSGDPSQSSLQEEVVRLTGRDVSGTYFELPDALGSIVFSSDEKNVYDGFHAVIKKGACLDV